MSDQIICRVFSKLLKSSNLFYENAQHYLRKCTTFNIEFHFKHSKLQKKIDCLFCMSLIKVYAGIFQKAKSQKNCLNGLYKYERTLTLRT